MFIAYRYLFHISNSLYDQIYAARYLPFPNLLFRFFLQLQSSQLPGASYRAERLEGAFAKVAKHGCTGEEQEIFNRATWARIKKTRKPVTFLGKLSSLFLYIYI